MKWRVLSVLLVIAMFCTLLPQLALVANAETYGGTCGDNVTWTLDSVTGVLTISGEGKMYDYYDVMDLPWHLSSRYIKSCVINNGVMSIGIYAFNSCTKLKSVTIPKSVTSIGSWAFEYCAELADVIIPDSVTSISHATFSYCTGLTNVTIPDSVSIIEYDAFYCCTGLKSVTIPDSVTSIGNNAFYGCSGLTNVTFGNGAISIGDGAFAGCVGLTNVSFGNGVTSIGGSAFYGCTGLTCITIPNSVTSIHGGAFSGCTELKEVIINSSNIGSWFAEYTSIESITLGDSVTSIGDSAFYGCTGLTSVTLGNSVTSIGDSTFYNCAGLTSITIPNSVTSIGNFAFGGCSGLTSVTLGNSVTSIGNSTFYNCAGLTSITVPESVVKIGENAFEDCSALTDVTILNKKCQINAGGNSIADPVVTTLHGYKESTADYYARLFAYRFELLDSCGNGHDWGEWVYNNDATYDADGTNTRVCKNDPTHTETVTAEGTKLEKPKPTVKFSDVADGAFYAEAVDWAVSHDPQVTNGMSATLFAPGNKCTRAQVVTFLWRAAGCPELTSTNNPFNDVKSSAYYYKAVLWAVENSVTNGMSAITFAPNAECTRDQVVTFLWRANDKPAPTKSAHSFTDVSDKGFYYDAMLWAVETGVTNGMSATAFAPNATCTRGQVVTFLYRTFK